MWIDMQRKLVKYERGVNRRGKGRGDREEGNEIREGQMSGWTGAKREKDGREKSQNKTVVEGRAPMKSAGALARQSGSRSPPKRRQSRSVAQTRGLRALRELWRVAAVAGHGEAVVPPSLGL